MEDVAQVKIDKEVKEGRVLGPFLQPPVETLCVSPLGLVPEEMEGESRLVLIYFSPLACLSVIRSFMIRSCAVGAEMAKCDVKLAFRLLPVHPDNSAYVSRN